MNKRFYKVLNELVDQKETMNNEIKTLENDIEKFKYCIWDVGENNPAYQIHELRRKLHASLNMILTLTDIVVDLVGDAEKDTDDGK